MANLRGWPTEEAAERAGKDIAEIVYLVVPLPDNLGWGVRTMTRGEYLIHLPGGIAEPEEYGEEFVKKWPRRRTQT